MQRIEKQCKNLELCHRKQSYYLQARRAFAALLQYIDMKPGDRILLPAYIGWSENEGSGVFDPINECGLIPVFYHLDRKLNICVEDCKDKIKNSGAKVILIIHYFGFVDESTKEICEYAKENGIIVVEDAAHALFTDHIGMACGRYGDYTLYSLHKMLPFNDGGVLVSNGRALPDGEKSEKYDYSEFDLVRIAKIREENYHLIKTMLVKYSNPHIHILKEELAEGIIPQSFPVILIDTDRNRVYSDMNDLGWGLVSLYHTMISNIRADEYEDECWVSRHITNLPVHQGIDRDLLDDMIADFVNVVENNSY